MNSMMIVAVCALVAAASAAPGVLLGGALAGPSDAATVLGPDGSAISSRSLGGAVSALGLSAPVGPIASVVGPSGAIATPLAAPLRLGAPILARSALVGPIASPIGLGAPILSRSLLAGSVVSPLGLGLGLNAW